jgi:hypothetical protein
MKQALLIFIICIVYVACGKSSSSGENPLLLGKWTMVAIENLESGEIIRKNPVNTGSYCNNRASCDVVLELKNVNNKRTVGGHTITNTMFGEFVVGENSSLKLMIGMTQVGDAKWSDYLINNLHLISTYDATPRRLYLYFDNKKQRLQFSRQ